MIFRCNDSYFFLTRTVPFLQIENQSGLSNFIPVLIGDKETCVEMEILQQKREHPSSQNLEHSSPHTTCKVLASRQSEFSELVLDVAWLLKKPASQQKLTSSHIQRLNLLFEYLLEKESTFILNRLYSSLRSAVYDNLIDGHSDSDMRLLQTNMDTARRRLAPRLHEKVSSKLPAPSGNCYSHSSENDNATLRATNQVCQVSRLTSYLAMNARLKLIRFLDANVHSNM